MPRDKVFTLFNRNQVSITKTIHEKAFDECSCCVSSSGSPGAYTSEYANYNRRWGWVGREVVKESPLGFYYKKKVKENQWDKSHGVAPITGLRYRTLTMCYSKTSITIKYPFENVKSSDKIILDKEHYAWELCGSGMPEHFISDLYETIKFISGDLPSSLQKRWKEHINSVLLDLFKSTDGIDRVYTDEMKIAAHGFDPKLSFRKEKENKS